MRKHHRLANLLTLVLLLTACNSRPQPASTPVPAAPIVPQPTLTVTLAQPAPSATALPSATPAPPSPTPSPAPTLDPWASYAPLTIEGLRSRSYGEGAIEIIDVMEEAAQFTRYLFAYKSDGLRITGMLNRPRGDGPFPVVILNHGYYPLDVYQTGNGSKLAADYLANRGFLTLSPDFRSHAGSDDAPNLFRAGHVIDVLNLIPLAQRLPSAQPGKIGMWGHSNGGAITAKAIVISDQIAASVIYAPASLTIAEDYQFRMERSRARAGQPPGQRSGIIDRLAIEFPVTPEQAPDLYSRLSPLGYMQNVNGPVQIYWGSADDVVPAKWPGDLRDALLAAGKPVEYIEYAGQPHSFVGVDNQRYLQRMAEFFEAQLK